MTEHDAVTKAISQSILQSEIVWIDLNKINHDSQILTSLHVACDGWVDTGEVHEFWGARDDTAWRVHVRWPDELLTAQQRDAKTAAQYEAGRVVRITTERRQRGRNYYSDLLVNGTEVATMSSNIHDWSLGSNEVQLITKALDAAGVLWTFNGGAKP